LRDSRLIEGRCLVLIDTRQNFERLMGHVLAPAWSGNSRRALR
jgi:hypothetical protein